MKRIVLFDEFNEIDLKPSVLLKEYIRLTALDIKELFLNGPPMKECSCPGCGESDIRSSFPKYGMTYNECSDCGTLYVSPRPEDKVVEHYYHNSNARKFWREKLSNMTSRKRQDKIIKPRFDWIIDSAMEYLSDEIVIADINTDQHGYISALLENDSFTRRILYYPFLSIKYEKFNNGIELINSNAKEKKLKDSIDVITMFEVLDHTSDPDSLIRKVTGLLKKGGLGFLTAILASGFDLQMLWEKAENVFPPDRLNVFSVEGLKSLFARHNLECLEFSTPGILDVEIVANAMKRYPDFSIPKFFEYILKSRDEECQTSLQEFLQNNLLSSYGRILVRKN